MSEKEPCRYCGELRFYPCQSASDQRNCAYGSTTGKGNQQARSLVEQLNASLWPAPTRAIERRRACVRMAKELIAVAAIIAWGAIGALIIAVFLAGGTK